MKAAPCGKVVELIYPEEVPECECHPGVKLWPAPFGEGLTWRCPRCVGFLKTAVA